MPVSPAMMPDDVPASDPMRNILRRTASLSGWVTADHQHSSRLLRQPAPLAACWLLPAPLPRGLVQLSTASLGSCFVASGFSSSTTPSVSAPQGSCSGLMMQTHCTSDARLLQLLALLALCRGLSCGDWRAAALSAASSGAWLSALECCCCGISTTGSSILQIPNDSGSWLCWPAGRSDPTVGWTLGLSEPMESAAASLHGNSQHDTGHACL